jgi:hypothetical protein
MEIGDSTENVTQNKELELATTECSPKPEEECIELKNIKYKTMLINGVTLNESKASQSMHNLDKFLENEKNSSENEPWCKLNKTIKIKKITEYVVDDYKQQHELVKLREAELKHGRWGMISAVAIPLTELVTHEQAIHALDNANAITVTAFTSVVAATELQSMLLGWENPFTNSSNYFLMRNDYQPGDLGFNMKKSFLGKDETFMLNAELNNGRLAMIGSLGMIVQELVSNQPLF